MLSGIINILVGAILIVAGMSGWFVMRGTNTSVPLIVIGALLVAYGLFQMIPKKKE